MRKFSFQSRMPHSVHSCAQHEWGREAVVSRKLKSGCLVSECSLIDRQPLIDFMSQHIFLEPLYARRGANTTERSEVKSQWQMFSSFDRIVNYRRRLGRLEEGMHNWTGAGALSLKVVLKEVSPAQRSEKRFCMTPLRRVRVGGKSRSYA